MATYKPGLAKLLARIDPVSAAKTNDNFAYFATARFMEQTFKSYPQYPLAWDNGKSPEQNRAEERNQPGDPDAKSGSTGSSSTALDDGDPSVDGIQVPSVTDKPIPPASLYPDWYQPVLSAAGSSSVPPISEPSKSAIPPATQPADLSSIQCNYKTDPSTTDPTYDDCVQAFAPAFVIDQKWTSNPPKPDQGVTSYRTETSGSCTMAINYAGDWTNCNATYGDVWAHARIVFEACADYSKGTVGGSVSFSVNNCPASISINHTDIAIS
jgi:hypothetical protein